MSGISMYRGMGRDMNLVKTTFVIPAELLRELDRLVADRKMVDQGFNRSALVENIIRSYLDSLNDS